MTRETTDVRRPLGIALLLAATAALLVACVCLGARRAAAAELRLRPKCEPAGALVTLGDVAEVIDNDPQQAQRLASLDLFPAPAASSQRLLRLRELQDLLLLRGLDLTAHRLSGSSQVLIVSRGQEEATVIETLSQSSSRRANRRLTEAVVEYLHTLDSRQSWNVVALPDEQLALAASDPANTIALAGGAAPYTGRQQFLVNIADQQGVRQFSLAADVSLPPMVVVATHSLSRGALVRATDVALVPGPADADGTTAITTPEDVIGRETTRAITEGRVFSAEDLRSPLLVTRGEVVTVYAISAGIRVRTTARARDEGSLGELVAVESLLNRETYFARVSGVREVEVFAQPASAGSGGAVAAAVSAAPSSRHR